MLIPKRIEIGAPSRNQNVKRRKTFPPTRGMIAVAKAAILEYLPIPSEILDALATFAVTTKDSARAFMAWGEYMMRCVKAARVEVGYDDDRSDSGPYTDYLQDVREAKKTDLAMAKELRGEKRDAEANAIVLYGICRGDRPPLTEGQQDYLAGLLLTLFNPPKDTPVVSDAKKAIVGDGCSNAALAFQLIRLLAGGEDTKDWREFVDGLKTAGEDEEAEEPADEDGSAGDEMPADVAGEDYAGEGSAA